MSLFPDPTEDERDHMRRLAGSVLRRVQVIPGDQDAFLEDLEMAGWLAFYRYFSRVNRWDLAWNAMMDEWCKARFGVTHRGKKDQRPRTVQLLAIEEWLPMAVDQGVLEAREILTKLCERLEAKPRYRGLQTALRGIALADGGPLTPDERLSCGITSANTYSVQKKILRRLVTDLQQDAA